MDAFDVVEGGCVVAAAAGIVTALRSCKCGGSRGLLRDALDVVAQLGDSPGEEKQLLRLWTAGVSSVGQGQSAVVLAACVDSSGLEGESLSAGASGSLVADRVLGTVGTRMGDLSCVDPLRASGFSSGSGIKCVGSGLGVGPFGSENWLCACIWFARTNESDTSV